MQRITFYYASIFMVLALLSDQSNAETTIIIKFSHVATANSPKGLAATRFKELAELATKGRVRVDIYPNGQLYKDNEELEALQLDAVQMLAPSLSKFAALGIHDFELFDLPYLFPNSDALHRITQGAIGRDLLRKLEPQGIVGLNFWDNGFKNFSADVPLHTPNDLRGLKIRIQPSKVLDREIRDLGATPLALVHSAFFEALQNKFVDGAENTPVSFYAQQFTGSQKYLTLTNHGYVGYAVIINKNFWDDLPAEIRVQLSSALNETTKYANAIAQQENDLDLIAIKKSGKTTVYELTESEKEQWHKALAPVQQQMESRLGKDLLAAVNRELANTHE